MKVYVIICKCGDLLILYLILNVVCKIVVILYMNMEMYRSCVCVLVFVLEYSWLVRIKGMDRVFFRVKMVCCK